MPKAQGPIDRCLPPRDGGQESRYPKKDRSRYQQGRQGVFWRCLGSLLLIRACDGYKPSSSDRFTPCVDSGWVPRLGVGACVGHEGAPSCHRHQLDPVKAVLFIIILLFYSSFFILYSLFFIFMFIFLGHVVLERMSVLLLLHR